MPKSSKVHKMYSALLHKGYDKTRAAKISQAVTGQSLRTGRSNTAIKAPVTSYRLRVVPVKKQPGRIRMALRALFGKR